MLLRSLKCFCSTGIEIGQRNFTTSTLFRSEIQKIPTQGNENQPRESARMQEFHEKLNATRLPPAGLSMRLVDLVLVETDPKSGELIPNTEKEPTKWGDWQHGGRVTDF